MDYPNKELWYRKTNAYFWTDFETAAEHQLSCGTGNERDGRGFDIDRYINSEVGSSTMENLYPFLQWHDDPGCPEAIAYWAGLGMKKEIHDADDPDRVWSIFTPIEETAAPGRTYPVVFCFHGKNNPIPLSETYGYVRLGGKEKFIVICPWGKNCDGQHDKGDFSMADEVMRIWAFVRENYPVDLSRVYTAGFSGGGRAAQVLAFRNPTMFAAIAPSPQFFVVDAKEAEWAALEKVGCPVVCASGAYDRYLPVRKESWNDNIRHWLHVNGINNAAAEAMNLESNLLRTSYADPAVAKSGIPFPTARIERHDGCDWYVGEFQNGDGVPVVRMAVVSEMPHWPTGYWAEFHWSFLKHWHRDPASGKTLYTKE